jgi:aspartate/tyrosine/aromatic aminotransferase
LDHFIEVGVARCSRASSKPTPNCAAGLKGIIIESNSLRATYFADMNDAQEIHALRVHLVDELKKRLETAVKQATELAAEMERMAGLTPPSLALRGRQTARSPSRKG